MYYSVQTGFSNFQIVSTTHIDPEGEIVFSGERSDYYVTVPQKCSFADSVSLIQKKLLNLQDCEESPSPLIYHDEIYQEWDSTKEEIYHELFNNMRKPFTQILIDVDTYSDKIMDWIRNCKKLGQVIVLYFPMGLAAYQPTTYCIETNYDSLLIDLFSLLPVSTTFFRVAGRMLMSTFLPFRLEGKYVVRKTLSVLRKKELVEKYTNSIDEYFYRPEF